MIKELVRSHPDGDHVLLVDLNSPFCQAATAMAPYLSCSLTDAAHAMHTHYLRWPHRSQNKYDAPWLDHVVACIKAGQMRLQDNELLEVQSSCWLPICQRTHPRLDSGQRYRGRSHGNDPVQRVWPQRQHPG